MVQKKRKPIKVLCLKKFSFKKIINWYWQANFNYYYDFNYSYTNSNDVLKIINFYLFK